MSAGTPDAPVADPLRGPTLAELRRRTSVKWRAYPPDVLPLWVAEMDTQLAAPVAEAVRTAIDLGDTGYATVEPYAEAVAEFAERRWDWQVPTERIALVPDVMRGIAEVLKLVMAPDDAVVVNSPVYPPFYAYTEHLGLRVVEAPLGEDGRIGFAALAEAFASARAGGHRAAYLLCSPHNPTGTVHTAAELARVAALAGEHGVRVVADEIHAPLVPPGARHVPYLTVPGAERGFALLSASKAWNLAGLKSAVAVAGEESAGELALLPEEMSHGASHLGALAHVAAFRHGGPWLDALLAGLDESRRLLGRLLAERLPGVEYRAPDGTFLAWLDCRALGLGDDPAAVFLERGRVALASGIPFGTGGAGHARLNFATSPEVLTEAVDRMATAVEASPQPGGRP
ncbi:aminotransferase class I/II-fold pyridoxal phosphate-dependent enzyme [Streptomyces sp. NBC_01808]|uniref:MalY/PatB family protein n=1 Tax=Streptomyces sp. NBC_01808 TaxID=2975947 RepID=UPI002DD7F06E|nr:aminotransferase class I/II-fold pyridoxal phosphate-dependent enzyme [Streptomyces sp. NBC_01808]WSA36942.1 aminotransferase class I/II-fold pyridoxal phosphate-dependent enzyme [Streptomyces sp. NBC_01808]